MHGWMGVGGGWVGGCFTGNTTMPLVFPVEHSDLLFLSLSIPASTPAPIPQGWQGIGSSSPQGLKTSVLQVTLSKSFPIPSVASVFSSVQWRHIPQASVTLQPLQI